MENVKLTGRTRHKIKRTIFREFVVIEVEEVVSVADDMGDFSPEVLRWREATGDDLVQLNQLP